MRLEQPSRGDYQALIALWEASVRATHHFLPDEEIATLRELILEHYFDAVTSLAPATTRDRRLLRGARGQHRDAVHRPGAAWGRGWPPASGRCHRPAGATRVDVNEQNEQALGFYRHLGFEVVGRSPLDGQGKPYPLLHMTLAGQ